MFFGVHWNQPICLSMCPSVHVSVYQVTFSDSSSFYCTKTVNTRARKVVYPVCAVKLVDFYILNTNDILFGIIHNHYRV